MGNPRPEAWASTGNPVVHPDDTVGGIAAGVEAPRGRIPGEVQHGGDGSTSSATHDRDGDPDRNETRALGIPSGVRALRDQSGVPGEMQEGGANFVSSATHDYSDHNEVVGGIAAGVGAPQSGTPLPALPPLLSLQPGRSARKVHQGWPPALHDGGDDSDSASSSTHESAS
jgi:hypothetical protein